MNKLQILPKDMTSTAKEFEFARLSVKKNIWDEAQNILSAMYNGNMQMRKVKDLLVFHRVDSPLLWLINIIKYCC